MSAALAIRVSLRERLGFRVAFAVVGALGRSRVPGAGLLAHAIAAVLVRVPSSWLIAVEARP